MSQWEFKDEFNRALDLEDWPKVITLGESHLAQYGSTPEVVYNLGLAYLKIGNSPMAVSMFLALPKNTQNAQAYISALKDSLAATGHDVDALDMGAHGLTAVAVNIANAADKLYLQAAASVSLPFLVVLIYMRFVRPGSVMKSAKSNFSLNTALIFTALITFVAFFVNLVSSFYSSNWCSIVSKEPAVIHSSPGAESPVVRTLSSGTPLLVLGSIKSPWLYSLESRGAHGWVDSLKVRCVVEKK
jgi:hypothetical protein